MVKNTHNCSQMRELVLFVGDYWSKEFESMLGESLLLQNPVNPILSHRQK